MSNLVEVVDTEQMGPSPSTGTKRRRFVISQQPIGTALRTSEQKNSNNMATLCMEVRDIKSTMTTFSERMENLESKLNCVLEKCVEIVERMVSLDCQVTEAMRSPGQSSKNVLFNTSVVNKHHQSSNSTTSQDSSFLTPFTESSQIIRLNTEADYPDGCWLGDPNSLEERVRVGVNRLEMDALNTTCSTPEKMALALLETLFSREVLAQSNLTGKGKHKKKQLDPLLIFGIFCHLKYRFNIHETDWARIKNNMDAKCRFFWSRRCKGLPLGGSRVAEDNGDNVHDVGEDGGHGAVVVPVVQAQYPSYSMYSVWDGQGQARLVTVGGEGEESVYQLDTHGDFAEVGDREQFGDSVELGEDSLICGTVMVSSGGDIMLGGEEQEEEEN